MRNWPRVVREHPRLADAALIGLLLCAAGGTAELNAHAVPGGRLGWQSAVPLAVAGAVALLWRRGHPRAVVAVTAACAGAAGAIGYLVTPVLLGPLMVALYELALRVPARTTRGWYLAVTAAVLVGAAAGERYGYPWFVTLLGPVLFLLLPVVLADSARLRQAQLTAATARAEHAERTREQEARHRVAEERVRIARDLHDVVAHHLALANAQAGTAAYLAADRPDQARRILAELAGTTSTALRELKATVGLLRDPDGGPDGGPGGGPDGGAPLEPAPGLARLPELTAAFAAAGLDVEVTAEGAARPLPPAVELTAFRVVQEALTNVTRHAATDRAAVTLGYGDGRLTVSVSDDGPAVPAAAAPGFGLVGMRERVRSAGGRLHAGPRPGGGFTVTAELPIRP